MTSAVAHPVWVLLEDRADGRRRSGVLLGELGGVAAEQVVHRPPDPRCSMTRCAAASAATGISPPGGDAARITAPAFAMSGNGAAPSSAEKRAATCAQVPVDQEKTFL